MTDEVNNTSQPTIDLEQFSDPYYGRTAVKYARVSTKDKGQTTDTQIREIDKWGEQHHIKWVGEEDGYRDEKSGSDLDRPSFDRMIGFIARERPNLLVAYDVSRLTRNGEVDYVKRMIEPFGCHLAFVTIQGDLDSLAGEIQVKITETTSKYENVVRNEKTSLGLKTRQLNGDFVGRPAAIMFAEDLETQQYLRGRAGKQENGRKVKTQILTEEQFYSYAKKGYSLYKVAKEILGISDTTLMCAIRVPDGNPKHRYVAKVDRYTPYMELYKDALHSRKGLPSETPEKQGVRTSERVVE